MGANGVRLGADNRLECVRTAPPEDPASLRRTIQRLREAAGPGIVEIVSCADDGDRVELVLAFAGRSLAAPQTAASLAPVLAAAAAHLADLHLRGLAHGAIAPEHVLVDATGGARLCGLAEGEPADDVAAFGRLIDEVLDPDDSSDAASSLRAVAARCRAEDATARPTMAAVAASLATTPSARRAVRVQGAPRARPRRPLVVGAAILGIAATGMVGALAAASTAGTAPRRSSPTSSTSTTSTTRQPPAPPREFEHGGATWVFGTERDQLLLGDWNCDSVPTPGLLDERGALFVIDSWPEDGELEARHVTTVEAARRAEVVHRTACDHIVIETADGEIRPELRV